MGSDKLPRGQRKTPAVPAKTPAKRVLTPEDKKEQVKTWLSILGEEEKLPGPVATAYNFLIEFEEGLLDFNHTEGSKLLFLIDLLCDDYLVRR